MVFRLRFGGMLSRSCLGGVSWVVGDSKNIRLLRFAVSGILTLLCSILYGSVWLEREREGMSAEGMSAEGVSADGMSAEGMSELNSDAIDGEIFRN